jgi:hypothetical protein
LYRSSSPNPPSPISPMVGVSITMDQIDQVRASHTGQHIYGLI